MEIVKYDVTCIMPVYNTQKYVKEALLSILQQQGGLSVQIIVVDDGSSDDSVSIVKKLQNTYNNIDFYQQRNSGPAVARNFAMSKARGKYMMFVDSDDLLPENAIKQLHVNIEANQSQIAIGMFEAFNRRRRWKHESMRFFVDVYKACTYLDNFPELINNMSPWNKMYRRDFIQHNQLKFLDDVQLREDIYFVCNALYKAKRITVIPDLVYYYRARDENEASLTTRIHVKVFDDIFYVSEQLDSDESNSLKENSQQVRKYRYQNELKALVYRLWPYVQRHKDVESLLIDVQRFLQKIGNDIIISASPDKRAILYKIKNGEFKMATMLIQAVVSIEKKSFYSKIKTRLKSLVKMIFWPIVNTVFTPVVFILKKRFPSLWLIGEQHGDAAKDTGYEFFLFCRRSYPQLPIYFVTKPGNIELRKINNIGNIIEYGSIHHYLFARMAEVFVFSDSFKDIFWDWQSIRSVSNLKIACFLQHGIFALKYSHDYYAKRAVEERGEQIDLMVVSSEKEKAYVAQLFGYSENALIVTGLSRFDRLYDYRNSETEQIVLYSPTWRNYLRYASDDIYLKSSFHKNIEALTQNAQLLELLQKYDYKLHVCFHHAAARFTKHYCKANEYIYYSDMNKLDLFEELIHSKMLITDYSSVCFDMAYIERPVAFYQFDTEEFVISEGGSFIDYNSDLFGVVSDDPEKIVEEIEYNINNEFKVRAKYQKKADAFFAYKDGNNSQRIFDSLQQKLGQYNG